MNLARGRLRVEQQLGRRLVEGLSEQPRRVVVEVLSEVLEGDRQSEELAKGVPAEMPFLHHLLDMFGRGSACTCLKQSTAFH